MGILNKVRASAPAIATPSPSQVADWSAPAATREVFGRTRPAVKDSNELARVLALPRRPPVDLENDAAKVAALIGLMTERLGRANPTCACAALGRPCIRELKAAQAWALYEAPLVGGLLAPIGVGHGKTGLDILMPMVMPGCKLAVLLIPPTLQDQLFRDWQAWGQHFKVPSLVMGGSVAKIIPGRPVLHVVPYSLLSRAAATDLLEQLRPDLILGDEIHKLRHRETATTGRVLRYFVNHTDTRLCGWSGTLTAKSIKDYAHLAALALREGSPLPLHPNTVDEWALAIDPPVAGNTFPAPRGALVKLGDPNEPLHAAFHRRLIETKGVVATRASAIDASIYISERKAPEIPAQLRKYLTVLRRDMVRPDGEEFVDALQVARCARELAAGFFYRWRYPRGEPEATILKWFDVRKAYHKQLRERLKNPREHMDSPLLCWNAAVRAHEGMPCGCSGECAHVFNGNPGHVRYKGDLPVWDSDTWPEWKKWRDAVYHESEAVWVDDYLARDAAEWARENRGIVWYEHEAFGARVSELSGLPLHGGGPDAGTKIAAEKGNRSIIVSIKSHGTGRDGLQHLFNKQLIANPPSSGDAWEQLLGRLHRHGQAADEVETWVYRHTAEMAEAIDKAVVQAKYIQGTMGTLQKLLNATIDFEVEA